MTTEEEEKIETCRTAMKAALEAIQDYCGAGETGKQKPDMPTIRFLAGHDVPMDYIPEDIVHIIDESPSSMSAIDKLIDHEWVKEQARKSRYFAVPEDAPKELQNDYIKYAQKKIAETLYWSRDKGTLETAKERE